MKKTWVALLGMACMSGGVSAQAAGFANNDFSASGVGVAGAMVAGVADVSAASYNPAAIAWLDGVRVQGGFASRSRNSSVKRTGGGIEPNNGSAKNASTFHASWMPHDSGFGMSMAFSQPFSADTAWGGDATQIKTDRLSLDLVYALSSTLAVAHGVDVYRSKVDIQQGTASFSGKDKASFGVNVGVYWKPAPLWSVGMMLRSGTKAKVKAASNQQLDLNLPEQVNLGVAHDLGDTIRLEADVAYERWSRLKNLNVSGSTIKLPSDLKDTVAIKTGLTWYWLPETTFRFGYAYEQGANRASAFQQAIVDQSGHRVSMGAGGELMGLKLDAAYAYTFHAKQTVSAPLAGDYRDREQSLLLSVSKVF